MQLSRLASTLVAVAAFGPTPRLTADEKFDAAELYEKCVKSCVHIVAPLKEGQAEGSGTLIDVEQRLVVTCAHVVDGDTVFAQFPIRDKDGELVIEKKMYRDRIKAGQAIKGKVLHRDKTRDLALVRLETVPADTPALTLPSKSVRVGEKVICIGNIGKVDSTFITSQGTVRSVGAVDMVVPSGDGDKGLRIKCRMITFTNPVPTQPVGGPVIDRRGFLVGVVDWGIFDGRPQNVNSAIDVTEVRAFLKENKVTIKEPGD